MNSPQLDLLVISDLHYIKQANHACELDSRKTFLGPVLIRKAIQRLRYSGISPDLLIILGDLVDDGSAAGAEHDLREIADELRNLPIPFLAIPGNHDGSSTRFSQLFDFKPGLFEFGGYGFLRFAEQTAERKFTTRTPAGFTLLAETAATRPEMPLIALQHNLIYPKVDHPYPYMLTNAENVLDNYLQHKVLLSLSGHFHRGQPVDSIGDLTTYTVPAACEAPFSFAHIQLKGRAVKIREHAFQIDVPALTDVHCHTEFAYCGTTVNANQNIEISKALGLGQLCLTEHSFQLYFDKDDAWSYRWQTDAKMVEKAWQEKTGRLREYRQFIRQFQNEFVKLGLEVDLYAGDKLLLAEEDRDGWDLLVGAIHRIPGFEKQKTSQSETERLFLSEVEKLAAHPIDVLAHPFRFFRHNHLACPVHLFEPIAELLARNQVAAEINFHNNSPDPRFIQACAARGVKIALGTDSHDLAEVSELAPHLRVLEQAGIRESDFAEVLFRLK